MTSSMNVETREAKLAGVCLRVYFEVSFSCSSVVPEKFGCKNLSKPKM